MHTTFAPVPAVSTDRRACIYALCEPDSGEVRYIGKTVDLEARLRMHLDPWRLGHEKSRKVSWLKSLLGRGLEPMVCVLQEAPPEQLDELEKWWIAVYRPNGRLTNGTEGGAGGAVTDPEAKARFVEKMTGRKASVETRRRMSEAARRRSSEIAERERLRSISNGRPPRHLGTSNSGSKLTDEQVMEIRRLYDSGIGRKAIAEQFGLTYQNVWHIGTRRGWRHIPEAHLDGN